MAIEKEVLDQLLAGRDAQELFAKDGLVDELKKALSERILNTELDEHLGEERVEGNANRRNGISQKTVLTGTSKMRLSIPRDRAGTFDPKLIAKYQRRFPDFDDKIISMYARGMSVREIRGHLGVTGGAHQITGEPARVGAVQLLDLCGTHHSFGYSSGGAACDQPRRRNSDGGIPVACFTRREKW